MRNSKLSVFNMRNSLGKEALSNRTYCSFNVHIFFPQDFFFKVMSFYSITMVICSLSHEEIGDEAQPLNTHGYNKEVQYQGKVLL